MFARRLLSVAVLAALPAAAEVQWESVRVNAHLDSVGTLELTEKHVLVATYGSRVASRRLDVRRPAEVQVVEVSFLDAGGGERELERGAAGEEDRYEFDIRSSTVSWTLRSTDSPPGKRPGSLTYQIRWKAFGAVTPVWGLRPVNRGREKTPWRDLVSARWRETREALRRAGSSPFRRYVLDVNLAAPGREGPIETLEFGLSCEAPWRQAGDLMPAKRVREVLAGETVDASFLFDWEGRSLPVGVEHALPALQAAVGLLPLAFVAAWLVEHRRALAARRNEREAAGPVPAGLEALSRTEADPADETPLFPPGKRHQLERVVFLMSFAGLLLPEVSVAAKAVVVVGTIAVAAGLLFAMRRVRDAGFALGAAVVPAALSPLLAAFLVGAAYLDPWSTSVVALALPSGLVVIRAGLLGARPRPGRRA